MGHFKICIGLFLGMLIAFGVRSETNDQGWMTFDGSSGFVSFAAIVNGQTASVILDSGASIGAVSEGFGQRAGIEPDPRLPIQLAGIFDEHRVFGSREFELELNQQTVALQGLAVVPGGGFDIVLGRWIFEQAVVQIDYPNQRIRFLDPSAVDFESNVKVRKSRSGALLIEMQIQGKRAWLTLDTGSNSVVLLKRGFVSRHGFEQYSVASARLPTGGMIRSGEVQLLQFEEAAIGPFRMESLLASYVPEGKDGLDAREQSTGSRVRHARTQDDGLVGFEVLRNFLVTTDFKHRKVHLHLP